MNQNSINFQRTSLFSIERDQRRWRGFARDSLQLFSSITGISSGPEAAFGFISSIAFIMSCSVKSNMSSVKGCLMVGGVKDAALMFVFRGSLKTEEN